MLSCQPYLFNTFNTTSSALAAHLFFSSDIILLYNAKFTFPFLISKFPRGTVTMWYKKNSTVRKQKKIVDYSSNKQNTALKAHDVRKIPDPQFLRFTYIHFLSQRSRIAPYAQSKCCVYLFSVPVQC